MAEPPSSWFYRLSPGLALCSPPPPPQSGPGKRIIVVRPGGAFPLGHPTTRLCLDLLREALASRPVHRFLDLGCGCGVLALAAAALGTPRVVGIDISPEAARATQENARRNGWGDALRVARGSTVCLKGPFDLIAANLPWEVQMDQVRELDRLAAADGRLILSGFRDNREHPLLDAYGHRGWTAVRRLSKDFRHPELPPHISFTWVAWLLEHAVRP